MVSMSADISRKRSVFVPEFPQLPVPEFPCCTNLVTKWESLGRMPAIQPPEEPMMQRSTQTVLGRLRDSDEGSLVCFLSRGILGLSKG